MSFWVVRSSATGNSAAMNIGILQNHFNDMITYWQRINSGILVIILGLRVNLFILLRALGFRIKRTRLHFFMCKMRIIEPKIKLGYCDE